MVTVLLAIALSPKPADAQWTWVWHGKDYAKVEANHRSITVWDQECDGHWVTARVRLNTGELLKLWAGDGCWIGAGYPVPPGTHIVRYQVCEYAGGCSIIRHV